VIIFGDGSQTRDLTYVVDVVEAFMLAATNEIDYGIFNVGTGTAYSFNAIVDLLNAALGTSIQPKYIDNPIKNYVQQTQADTQLAEEILGFKAETPLPKGIEKIKDFYTMS
jgi:UDP-glucose 4-epimerase